MGGGGKIVFKGACDLSIMSYYLKSKSIVEEFTYVGKNGNRIEHHNHSVNYLTLPFLSDNEKVLLSEECCFNDPQMFDTKMYDSDVKLVFVSTQIEPHLGIYRNKQTGVKIAFSAWDMPMTDPNYWDRYIKGNLYQNQFTLEWLRSFSNKYEYVGRLTPQKVVDNIGELLKKVSKTAKVCVLLGSEQPYLQEKNESFKDRHLFYTQINNLVKEYAKTTDRLLYISFNDYIHSQSDFTDNINHYQRRVYYEAALRANEIISKETGETCTNPNILQFVISELYRKFRNIASSIYHRIRLK